MPSGDRGQADFQIAHDDDGNVVITLVFEGTRFDGGRLPVSALSVLSKMQSLFNAVSRDVDIEINRHKRKSRHANVELVLTGDIDSGSARITALVVPLLLAVSPAAKLKQQITIDEAVRRVPIVCVDLAAGNELSHPTSSQTIEVVRDLSREVAAGESLIVDVAAPSSINADGEASEVRGRAVFTRAVGENLGAQLAATREESFFVTGQFGNLSDDHRTDDVQLVLVTATGMFRVPASATFRQSAARAYADDREAVFAVSGRAEVDQAGRIRHVTHLTSLDHVDRMFDMKARLNELQGLAEAPDDARLVARIARVTATIPTIVHRTGLVPALFLTDESEIEARWIIGSAVVNVTFGSTIELYVFDRATEQMVDDTVVGEDVEVLPGWAIADAINRYKAQAATDSG